MNQGAPCPPVHPHSSQGVLLGYCPLYCPQAAPTHPCPRAALPPRGWKALEPHPEESSTGPSSHGAAGPAAAPLPASFSASSHCWAKTWPSEPPCPCSLAAPRLGARLPNGFLSSLWQHVSALIRKGCFPTPSTPVVWPGSLLRFCSYSFRKGPGLLAPRGVCLLTLLSPTSPVRFPK